MSGPHPTLWGIDLVIVRKDDVGQNPVAVFPTAFEGEDLQAAALKLRLSRPKVPNMPDGCVVAGVRPHANHLMHLFGPQGMFPREGFEVLAGDAVHIQAARNRLLVLSAQA